LATTLEKKAPSAFTSISSQSKAFNAETVTTIATGFLKRIGNRGSLKPKRVSLEEGVYTVEIEMKKFSATVRVDNETQEIKGYEIQPRSEENQPLSVSPKAIMIIFGVSAAVHMALYFLLPMLGF
jgi:hypothetical protein